MKEEMSLRDLIITLWRGKYIIAGVTFASALLAFLISVLVISPVYKAEVNIDPSVFNVNRDELSTIATDAKMLLDFLDDLPESAKLAQSVKVTPLDSDDMLNVQVSYSDPQVAATAAFRIGEGLLTFARDLRLRQLSLALEIAEKTVMYLDEEIQALAESQHFIYEIPSFAYQFPQSFLAIDPVNQYFLEARGRLLVTVNLLMLEAERLQQDPDMKPANFVYAGYVPKLPVSPRPKFNIAVAGLLGLMISVGFVLVRHLWSTAQK